MVGESLKIEASVISVQRASSSIEQEAIASSKQARSTFNLLACMHDAMQASSCA